MVCTLSKGASTRSCTKYHEEDIMRFFCSSSKIQQDNFRSGSLKGIKMIYHCKKHKIRKKIFCEFRKIYCRFVPTLKFVEIIIVFLSYLYFLRRQIIVIFGKDPFPRICCRISLEVCKNCSFCDGMLKIPFNLP